MTNEEVTDLANRTARDCGRLIEDAASTVPEGQLAFAITVLSDLCGNMIADMAVAGAGPYVAGILDREVRGFIDGRTSNARPH